MFAEQYGPWAVIAGGSEGVGAGFARKLAAKGLNLVLLARKPGPLEALAQAIRAESQVEVRTLATDLTAPDMLERVKAATAGLEVGLMIYNAGAVSRFVEFIDGTVDEALRMVRLNVVGQTALAHHFGTGMRARGRGGIVLIGSVAGYAGGPEEICYSAAKAYTRIFSEGLWYEMKPHGVHVLGLILGLTRTPAMERQGLNMSNPEFPPADPDAVAQEGLDHLAEGPLWHADGTGEGAHYLNALPREQAVEFMAQGAKALHG